MIWGFKRAVKYALGTDIAGRAWQSIRMTRSSFRILVQETLDALPGRNLVHPELPVTFANIERLIPDCEAMSKPLRETSSAAAHHKKATSIRSALQESDLYRARSQGCGALPTTTSSGSIVRSKTVTR